MSCNKRMRVRAAPLFLIVALAACAAAWADSASLTGKILDPSGAAMPTVAVTIRANATGIQQTAVTSSDGAYTFTG
ncbi:MAG: carboxypeptidase-like regulatory domain-containing protein, partial [Bryobacteraceae bacterium]